MMRSAKVLFMNGKKQKLDPPKTIFQLKVTLPGIDPPIWRRLAVSCSITFHKLHKIMQGPWDVYMRSKSSLMRAVFSGSFEITACCINRAGFQSPL
jgi:hypothetical protein